MHTRTTSADGAELRGMWDTMGWRDCQCAADSGDLSVEIRALKVVLATFMARLAGNVQSAQGQADLDTPPAAANLSEIVGVQKAAETNASLNSVTAEANVADLEARLTALTADTEAALASVNARMIEFERISIESAVQAAETASTTAAIVNDLRKASDAVQRLTKKISWVEAKVSSVAATAESVNAALEQVRGSTVEVTAAATNAVQRSLILARGAAEELAAGLSEQAAVARLSTERIIEDVRAERVRLLALVRETPYAADAARHTAVPVCNAGSDGSSMSEVEGDKEVAKFVLGNSQSGRDGTDATGPESSSAAAAMGGSEAVVRAVLRAMFEERTAGVDWLLSANGARILETSRPVSAGRFWWLRRRPDRHGSQILLRATVEHTSGGVPADAGSCWAMAGRVGWVTVGLAQAVVPWRLVLQHIPIRVSPNGARSALRTFRLVGYRPGSVRSSKDEEVELVRGEYATVPGLGAGGRADEIQTHVQSFDVVAAVRVDRVRLYVEDNHGQEDFTCLYHPVLYAHA
jgi:hypothetical protein